MIEFDKNGLNERAYVLDDMSRDASLFTTGNGYMGVRGSLEEFGETRIQGAFVRGLIDEIVEIVEPFPDNIYMKKYYFDEEKLKKFTMQDSCINFPDFLLVRFMVGERFFFPWDGTVLEWNRSLDPATGVLTRRVLWDDGRGFVTEFVFERFASYDDEHEYRQRITVRPKNHKLAVRVFSGIDANVRTNGQVITQTLRGRVEENGAYYKFLLGKKYGYEAEILTKTRVTADGKCPESLVYIDDGIYAEEFRPETADEYIIEKVAYIFTSRDHGTQKRTLDTDYGKAYKKHIKKYSEIFGEVDVKIEGDDVTDEALRFANYHTLISAELHDSVHSLSAKALTGEKYNQFVWWDCEIYQLPFFTTAIPEVTRHALEYRYRMLGPAKKIAESAGAKGARYPFVSSVDGEEHVWIYARHPFLQVHIMSDIAYAILRYYDATGDGAFMREMGLEMLVEISRWWLCRAIKTKRGREIQCVTGTDEHHDYVDNDAYTNYLTAYILGRTAKLARTLEGAERTLARIDATDGEIGDFERAAAEIYLPKEKSGMIPQFDGYFSLSRGLETSGGGTGKSFQMKQAGLYHLSQIIKQPDVMLLYSYVDVGELPSMNANFDYYEGMCEASSSLTFPVHAICAARVGRMNTFLKYLHSTLFMDIDDIHACAYQGVHAGCAAGGRLAIKRGLMGLTVGEGGVLNARPKKMPFFKSSALTLRVRGTKIRATLFEDELVLEKISGGDVTVATAAGEVILKDKIIIKTEE